MEGGPADNQNDFSFVERPRLFRAAFGGKIVGAMNGLSDGQILIRPYRAEDIRAMYEAVRESVAEVSPWLPWCHADYTIEETTAFVMTREEAWRNDEGYAFGVFDAGGGNYLGGVGLNFINRIHQCANLGYWVRTSQTGRGVAARAARLAARFALEQLGFQRIEILAAIGNHASQRVAEKAGATREGTLRQRLLVSGRPQDAALYSFVAEDFG
ncbi:MAG TPA: GNAT family protein [Pyrinomonadaceae bacterium]|jgi:RimJ/RimL family protein N-acetyltransferase